MKRLLIGALILNLSLGLFGCSSSKAIDNSSSESNISSETTENTKKRSSDEMYELYASRLNEVEKLFEENNINFEKKTSKKNKKYDEYEAVVYEDSSKRNPGEISIARYGMAFEDNGEIKYISAKIVLYVDENEMKNKEFKFEETELYKLHNILVPDNKSEDEINKKVNNVYKDLISIENIESKSGNIEETMTLTPDCIDYTIIINP